MSDYALQQHKSALHSRASAAAVASFAFAALTGLFVATEVVTKAPVQTLSTWGVPLFFAGLGVVATIARFFLRRPS